jgi:hypothetical protein
MRQRVVGGIMALIIGMAPFVVMAQATALDEETRATVEALAKEVGAMVVPGITAPVGEVNLEPTPEPTDEPEDDPVVLTPPDLTDLAEYTNQGVTIQVPADWVVDLASDDGGPIFIITIPGTEVFMSLEADDGLDFPSVLGVALFRSQAELLMAEFAEEADISESSTVYTPQGLPMAKLAFAGEADGEEAAGVFYVLAPNESAYLLVGGGTPEEWEPMAEGVQLIAESITFDEDLISLEAVGDEPMVHTDADEMVEVEVPAGWFVMDTGDEVFPVILAEPEVRYVAAVGAAAAYGENFDISVFEEFLPTEGELDPELYDELIDTVVEVLSNSGSEMTLDEEQSDVFPRDGAVTVRVVGDAELEASLSMPVVIYADLRTDNLAMVAVFGDIESALADEDTILTVVESATGLESN